VVGINTAISTQTGYFMGYGLAVPIDIAREAMDDLLEFGRVVRGYLGIQMVEVDARLVREQDLGLEPPRGVFIDSIYANTPAARSELTQGDVVLSVDGQPVNEPNQVQTLIYGRDPGESVALVIHRADGRHSIDVVLGEREQDRVLARGHQRVEQLGLTVAVLNTERARDLGFTDDVARQLGVEGNRHAVVVVHIDPHSPAAARGLRVDDIITEIDQSRVESLDQFVRSVSSLEAGRSALFWFWRRDLGVDVRSLPIPSHLSE
jgi:serine protease Do